MSIKGWRNARVAETRLILIQTAQKLFGSRGYAGTALEEVAGQAGLTRGALYHHFRDKKALFEVVVDGVLLDVVNEVERRTLKRALERGHEREADALVFFLEALCDPQVHRILAVDGPAVLGRERWGQLMGARLLAPVRRAVDVAAERGALPPEIAGALAHLLFGAIAEAAILASDSAVPRPELDHAVDHLLERLLGSGT